jgi:hypothetical protein
MGIGGETELNMVAVVNATRTCGRFRRRDFVVVGGDAAVTMGTYIKVMAAMDLGADVALLARDDKTGHLLQDARLPARRVGTTFPRRIRLAKYPQLKSIAWSLADDAEVGPAEAFALYERNWRHVDTAAMDPAERALLAKLTATIGKGVMNV